MVRASATGDGVGGVGGAVAIAVRARIFVKFHFLAKIGATFSL